MPGMLLLGSAGRNSGKTEFACSVLRKFAGDRNIVGIKVTAVRRKDGTCPRGGKGCGVCSSLDGDFCITEETDRSSGKDTSRLLAAGADRVFWLRVMVPALAKGLDALLDLVGHNAVCVCESNSLRTVVKPGLFFMIKDRDAPAYKASAHAVRTLADRLVLSDGRQFDFDLSTLRIVNGTWILREHAAAVVLAGGRSTRMGHDKSMLDIAGRPMIQHVANRLRDHFDEMLVSANDTERYRFLDLKIIPDRTPGMGPMMGIASALQASAHDLNLVAACDIPDPDTSLAHRMLARADGCDAVVPRSGKDLLEPLFAVYRKSVSPIMFALLQDGDRAIRQVFTRCRTRFVEVSEPTAVRNLNTMEEYQAYVGRAHAALR